MMLPVLKVVQPRMATPTTIPRDGLREAAFDTFGAMHAAHAANADLPN